MGDRIGDLFAGRVLRDEAIEQVSRRREEYVRAARSVAFNIACRRGYVTSDDVVRELPIPEGIDPRILGAVFNPRVRGFPLRKSGQYVQTTQKQAHARPIPVWVIK